MKRRADGQGPVQPPLLSSFLLSSVAHRPSKFLSLSLSPCGQRTQHTYTYGQTQIYHCKIMCLSYPTAAVVHCFGDLQRVDRYFYFCKSAAKAICLFCSSWLNFGYHSVTVGSVTGFPSTASSRPVKSLRVIKNRLGNDSKKSRRQTTANISMRSTTSC